VEKYFRAGQALDENTSHAHCMLHTQGFKRTVRICNVYCFYIETMVAGTVLNYTHFAFLLVFKRCMSPFIIDRHG
jgi:hypothetical protein